MKSQTAFLRIICLRTLLLHAQKRTVLGQISHRWMWQFDCHLEIHICHLSHNDLSHQLLLCKRRLQKLILTYQSMQAV